MVRDLVLPPGVWRSSSHAPPNPISSARVPLASASTSAPGSTSFATSAPSTSAARPQKRKRHVVENDDDTEGEEFDPSTATISVAPSKRKQPVIDISDGEDDVPLRRRKVTRVDSDDDDDLDAPAPRRLSRSIATVDTAAQPSNANVACPNSFSELLVCMLDVLMPYLRKLNDGELLPGLSNEDLASMYVEYMKAASVEAFEYADFCVAKRVVWAAQALMHKLPDTQRSDRDHGVYLISLLRNHFHMYGGSSTDFGDGMGGRMYKGHFNPAHRKYVSAKYLYRLWDQPDVQVTAKGKTLLRFNPVVSAQHGHILGLVFETLTIELFCGWQIKRGKGARWSMPADFPQLVPRSLVEAFAQGLTTSPDASDWRSLMPSLGWYPTNVSLPVLEEIKASNIDKLIKTGSLMTNVLFRDRDSLVYLIVTQQRWITFTRHIEEMERRGFRRSAPTVEVTVSCEQTFAPDNFAGVSSTFSCPDLPDVCCIVVTLTWITEDNSSQSLRVTLDVANRNGTLEQTKLTNAIFAQTLWEHVNGTLDHSDAAAHGKFRQNFHLGYKDQKSEKAFGDNDLAERLFSATGTTIKKNECGARHALYCLGCQAGPFANKDLFSHLGLDKWFPQGLAYSKSRKGHNPPLRPSTIARVHECRKAYTASGASLSRVDVLSAYPAGTVPKAALTVAKNSGF